MTNLHWMKRLVFYLLLITHLIIGGSSLRAQLLQRAEEVLTTALESNPDSLFGDGREAASMEERIRQDSIRLHEMALRYQDMKLREMLLQSELDSANGRNHAADSVKRAAQLRAIDSLRSVTRGVPVVVEHDTLFLLYASLGGRSAMDRAEGIAETIAKIGEQRRLSRDSVHLLPNESYIDIMYGDKVLMTVTMMDALWEGTDQEALAEAYSRIMAAKIEYLKNENSFWMMVKRSVLFVLVLMIQYLIFKLVNRLFKRLRRRIVRMKQQKMKAVLVKNYELLNTDRLCRLMIFASNVVRYFLLLLILVLTVPILFSIFPQTEGLAMKILDYILDPVKMVAKSVVDYIPNLFIIVVIWYCVRYLVKGFRYLAHEVETEKLKISGFYPEWAQPTFNIIRFLLYAFMVAMIYPYLPGAKSGVFQGISVFVGLIVSLGSSTIIANFIAGFVITYMRPFKPGDFIKVKETVGTVVEKTPFITRMRTIKNEIVTIPNSFIMSSDTVNYSASARRYGLIIHTVMTMGYDVPWRKVHELLIASALETEGVDKTRKPFVLELELNDNYMCYQINAYIKNADEMPDIMSELLEHIQDNFHRAEIDLVAPHFYSRREGEFPKDRTKFRRIHSLED